MVRLAPWPGHFYGGAKSVVVLGNRVARSLPFAEQWWQRFAEAGAPFSGADDLWRAMNPLAPGVNRVEADELSYGLHLDPHRS